MKIIHSAIENYKTTLFQLERTLKPMGFSIGGGWEYDHGYFDYLLSDRPLYICLRIPFQAVEGQLDHEDVIVQCGQPFLLAHQYEDGVDREGDIGPVTASFNQFQTPVDPDAEIDVRYEPEAIAVMNQAERSLQL